MTKRDLPLLLQRRVSPIKVKNQNTYTGTYTSHRPTHGRELGTPGGTPTFGPAEMCIFHAPPSFICLRPPRPRCSFSGGNCSRPARFHSAEEGAKKEGKTFFCQIHRTKGTFDACHRSERKRERGGGGGGGDERRRRGEGGGG